MSSISAGTTSGSALVSAGDTSGDLILQVNGSTPSVSLKANGSVGLGASPSYGTAGQLFTSGGSSAAPTWTTVSSGLTLLSTVTASSSSTVNLETGIGSSYDFYLITVTNVTTDANGIFKGRMKLGGSYRSDGYYAMSNGGYAGGSGNLAVNQNSADSFQLSFSNISSVTNSTLSGEFWFSNPTSTSVLKLANWVFGGYDYSGGSYNTIQGTGGNGNYTGSSAVLTGIQFFFTSGTVVTGTFRLYGFAK